MRRRLLDLVVCPGCGSSLRLSTKVVDGDEISEGTLACTGCERRYPIEHGIPRLLPDPAAVPAEARRTVDRFGDATAPLTEI